MRKPAIAMVATLLLALAGCDKPAPVATAAEPAAETVAAAPETPLPASRESLTAIDAALGDGAAMPAESYAPSAYDLALRAAAQPAVGEHPIRAADTRDAPATLAGSAAADLLHSDESLTTGG